MTGLTHWTPEKAKAFSQSNADKQLTIHLVLDESASMMPWQDNLIESVHYYGAFLEDHAPFLSTLDVRFFHKALRFILSGPLYDIQISDIGRKYDASRGTHTALFDAVYQVITTHTDTPGDHLLVVFTDGEDNVSSITDSQVRTVLETLQGAGNWMAVYLGAFDEAIAQGVAMGFPIGNCLAFPSSDIPEAFQKLTKGTKAFLEERASTGALPRTTGFFLQETNL